MRAPIGWYGPDTYSYNKTTGVLRHMVCVEFREYFDGDDWSWEERPVQKEITNPKEKERILAEMPDWLKQ